MNANPGPGAYASKERKIVPKVHDKMHNSFTTKVSLFFIYSYLRNFEIAESALNLQFHIWQFEFVVLMHLLIYIQIQRFCPTAPGSGLVTGPTYQKDPDPGHYYSEKKWNDLKYLDKTIQKYKSKEHKDLAVVPHGKAPSIPTKKLAATAYTHKGFDKVGPAGYNPKVPTVKS